VSAGVFFVPLNDIVLYCIISLADVAGQVLGCNDVLLHLCVIYFPLDGVGGCHKLAQTAFLNSNSLVEHGFLHFHRGEKRPRFSYAGRVFSRVLNLFFFLSLSAYIIASIINRWRHLQPRTGPSPSYWYPVCRGAQRLSFLHR